MATLLKKPLAREVLADVDGRGVRSMIVTLYPNGDIEMRRKGRSTRYTLPLGHAFLRAADITANQNMKERKRKRRVKRGMLSLERSAT